MQEAGKSRCPLAVFLHLLLSLCFQGARCRLLVVPAGPTLVNAPVGGNATLDVLFSGAPDPVVTWFRGALPVLTWTVGSAAPPDVANDYEGTLRIGMRGSLTFVDVRLDHAGNYTIELTKSGLDKAEAAFTLGVFELLQNVELTVQPVLVKEGLERFVLQYGPVKAEVRQQTWLFNHKEIKAGSRYTMEGRSLAVLGPARTDTGRYGLVLSNPLSRAEAHVNVTVRYGPDTPTLRPLPPQPFYVPGDSVSLVCQADASPPPTAEWMFGGRTLASQHGVLNLTNVNVSQSGVYTCKVTNKETGQQQQHNMTLHVYEKPSGAPICSVQSVNGNVALLFQCQWAGGAPPAQLRFPALSNGSGAGSFKVTVPASASLDNKALTCAAVHPVQGGTCNITASGPVAFLPLVRTSVNPQGKIVVTLACVSEASPPALVSWSKGAAAVANDATAADPAHHISGNTTVLTIAGYNVTNFILEKYTCTSRNPLGSQEREVHLQGPVISDFRLFPNPEGTIVTLTWEVPAMSIVTGFDVQMKGPNLLSPNLTDSRVSSRTYRTIQTKPGSARSADVFLLDPQLTYRFRVIPRAQSTEGKPSDVRRLGPGEGLSGPAIAGIAAGIPCSILFLLLLAGFIYWCYNFNMKRSELARYPVSRAVEKFSSQVITTQSETTPHHRLPAGLRSPPDYNKLHQTPSERSVALPTFVPPPPVRVATTV